MSVKRVLELARSLDREALPSSKEKLLSSNLITGVSVNLPIAGTCQPTKVCAANCYAARNVPIGMRVAVQKQIRLYNAMRLDPRGVGERLVRELRREVKRGVRFVRWNGVGDLFAEAVECVEYVAKELPELAVWVVTRLPRWAALVPDLPNVYVQFSLDRDSKARFLKLCALEVKSSRVFFSYTEAPDEGEAPAWLSAVPLSVYYTDLYKSSTAASFARVACPLNGLSDVRGACVECGRCWNGEALELRRGV